MNALSSRRWSVLLGVLIAIVYALVAIEAARCEFLLVDDYVPFAMIRIGEWPRSILSSIVDFTAPGAWLYRPFRDAMTWLFATIFRNEPGAWHLVLIALRLASVALALVIARQFSGNAAAAITGAAYFAFFPAMPELGLFRAESYLVPALAASFLGWLRLSRGGAGGVWWTATAFVLATMSKEVVAPLMLVLFLLLAPALWRRGRIALVVMALALASQLAHCALMLGDPYAQGSGARLLPNLLWNAKVFLLAATSFPLLSLLLAVLIVLGLLPLIRHWKGAAVLLVVSLAMAVAAPYPAIRYAYPAALFLVPCIALGVDRLRDRVKQPVAAVAIVLLAIFGGASLVAQAAAMRASSRADWQFLNEVADAFSQGHGIAIVDDPDFERSFWIRAELVGVDPRWPFLSYVARQYATGQPVVWPKAAGPVNLTGRVHRATTSREVLIVPANPIVGEDRSAFARFARLLNPRFHYAVDLGHSPYPGHSWVSRRISRAGLPPTSVNGSTSFVTTDPAATTAPRPR